MGVIVTKPGAGTGAGGSSSGAYSQAEKLALEMEMEFKAAKLYYYKEFSYTGNKLTGITIYEDNTKVVTLFSKILTYVSNKLTETNLTRTSDSATLKKVFAYTGSKLISITLST
jgi:hypothetical protein